MNRTPSEPLHSVSELVDFVRSGEKPPEAWRVGTEHEKIGLQREDLSPVPYAGERGIAALLEGVAIDDGWERVLEGGHLIALQKQGASITLEPGGQLELSGAPLRTIHETCDEFHHHLDVIRRVSEPLGLLWLSLGINPLHDVEDIPRMPKARYDIMRSYLPSHGELAMTMMHLTATVQANLDFQDEADMVDKMRTSLAISPIVSAIFANSSLSGGKPSGFVSRRMHVWMHTDPDRCGLLPFVFEPGFGYQRYVEWAADVPMFFLVRDGAYRPTGGRTFRQVLEHGFEGQPAGLADWEMHLTTLFPEVRLKRVLELRGADAVPPGLICALPALWKGLLYDAEARAASWELVREVPFEALQEGLLDVARRGLSAELGGRKVLALARELLAFAREGLGRIDHRGESGRDERLFLDPVAAVLEQGRSPGEEILLRWEGEWGRSAPRLIEYARY